MSDIIFVHLVEINLISRINKRITTLTTDFVVHQKYMVQLRGSTKSYCCLPAGILCLPDECLCYRYVDVVK